MTKIEGTLIDIAVRPACSGGVFQALEACKRAKDRASIGTLFATLRSLDDAYSYRQAIRFCLERAGYSATQYERLGDLGLDYDSTSRTTCERCLVAHYGPSTALSG